MSSPGPAFFNSLLRTDVGAVIVVVVAAAGFGGGGDGGGDDGGDCGASTATAPADGVVCSV